MLGFLLLLLSAVSADPGGRTYVQEGGEVELKAEGAPPTITSISWKFGPDLAADWDGATVDYYRHFEGRTQLNTSTGAMVLRSLNRTDTGKYTPEINNRILDPVQLSVIAAVPVPSITASCNEERTLCKMTCEADTAGAEPATFVWKADGREVQRSKTLQIQKNESSVKEFLCELRNPVSQESSSSPNPFSSSPTEAPGAAGSLNIPTGVTVFVVLLVLVLLLGVLHRLRTGSWFFQKDSMPWEADFWRRNGSPERTSVPTDDAASEKD
ncbi:carcinoembryonic antigen-related cell adhesion molecule 1 [Oryzias latipes]|uniref:Ig-like domain-containing protein n=1 Tax=Oryzias latipes TaxID=8090 RepID=A0A3B3HQY8_ORYLA|nr:carcinoembryonic antigen-related cell adhesion molecule 1 [Oryzias latipes]